MNAELEALLKAYDAFLQARGGSEEAQLFEIYESKLEDTCLHTNASKERLHLAVKSKYLRWIRANTRPSTMPPKA
ncbi:MAG TPA: hypothetical protein VFA77_15690 [Candidatus Eisenbacteria bacterium]|jgi:hypothetical protein|nr:hypothetical protein [Candidatus Eisenbacteria bacterium]